MKKILMLIVVLLFVSNLFATDYGVIDGAKMLYNYFHDFMNDASMGTSNLGRIDGQKDFQNLFIDFLFWADSTGATTGFPVDIITTRDSAFITIQDDVLIDSTLEVTGTLDASRIDCNTLYVNGEEFISLNQYWGVEWDSDTDTYTRLGNFSAYDSVGQAPSTYLPIHESMRRCVVEDDGTVAYYLNPYNSAQKADGSAANLDGTDGQVMVEIPDFYYAVIWSGDKVLIRPCWN